MQHTPSSLKERATQGYTLPEILAVLSVISILSVIAVPSYISTVKKASCISGKMDLPGLCWPEAQKAGSCWAGSTDCFFPRPGRRPGNVYSKPNGSREVSGFYVNLTSPDSTATIHYKGYLCSNNALGTVGNKPIESTITDSDYLDKRINYIAFPKGICGLQFYLTQSSRSSGPRIEFITNYSINR